jgi:hypothetical protein
MFNCAKLPILLIVLALATVVLTIFQSISSVVLAAHENAQRSIDNFVTVGGEPG